jgi:hypothetical protein
MRKRIRCRLIGVFLIASLCWVGCLSAAGPVVRADVTDKVYEVVSPVGEETQLTKSVSPNLDTLEGKTICEISVGMYRPETSFPAIRESLKKQYKGVNVIPYTEFPVILMMTSGKEYDDYITKQIALLKRRGCDAVITGNGG